MGARRGSLTGAGGADHGRVHGQFRVVLNEHSASSSSILIVVLLAAPRAAARPAALGAAARRAEELVEQVV